MEAASRLHRLRPYAIGLAIFFVLIGVFGFFAGPPLLRSVLTENVAKQLHRPVSVGAIAINPYAMTVRIADFKVGSVNEGGGETAGFDELFVNLDIASVFRAAPVIKEFRLAGPRVHLVHESPGRYNISDLLDEWMKPSDSPPPRFSVNNIQITGGRIEFDDKPVDRKHAITELNLAVPFIANIGHQAEVFTEPAFSAVVNGAPLQLAGKSKPFAPNKESELKLELDRFELAPYLAYSPVPLPFAVTGGALDTDLSLVFRNDGKEAPTLVVAGRVGLHELHLLDAAKQPLLNLGQLEVPLSGIEPLKASYRVGAVRVEGLEAFVRVDREGTLNWLTIASKLSGPAKPAPKPAQPAPAKAAPLQWSLEGLTVSGSTGHWQDDSNQPAIAANVKGIEVKVGKLDHRLAEPITASASWSLDAAPYAAAERIEISDAGIDLAKRRLALGSLAVKGFKVMASRQADGRLESLRAPALAGSREDSSKPSADESPQPWTVDITKMELAEALLSFEDKALTPATPQSLELTKLTMDGFSTAAGTSAKLMLDARINKKGELKADGTVQANPVAARLKLDLRGLELLPLQPYFGEKLDLTITKGQVASTGDVSLETGKDGKLAAGYRGRVTVGNFHSVDKANSADFLTWKSFHLDKIDFRSSPLALAIGEVALSDFYANMIVSPEGKLNLLQIVKKPEAPTEAAPAPSPAPPAPAQAAEAPKEPTAIRIDRVTLQGGAVNFTDNFIKPNYSAELSSIGGRVTGLSSATDTTADLDLRGEYDGAPLTIAGKLNPLAAKPSLDIKAEVHGVELTPMSPYSGKYAGYAIDKGKLSLFLAYKLDNDQLKADNRVFLDQLTFGERVDSPDATKLPVTLAVALLKNRAGEIDVNLPISGSLKDPQFSVGGIIVQVIVNLIAKAVTAPFALLGSLFGGGEELSYAAFDSGRASLGAETLKRLESLAKALDDRPGLDIEVTGRADPEKDPEGLRRAILEHKVKAQKLAQLVKAGKEVGSVDEVVVEETEYLALLEQAYKQEKFPKPRNVVGLAKSLPREEMEKLMLANAAAGEAELHELASDRGKAVADWLHEVGKIPRERIFLRPPKIAADGSGPKDAPLGRVEFSLK